jgi:predicted glycoside hydrolase/deacetylase ChbG (UPF0249 family)
VSRLILNADDFGLTAGVNRAIIELYRAGLLSSATLMAKAAATEEAIKSALSAPSLGVGCHVVLVDGEPALPPYKIPTLVVPSTARFHPKLGAVLRAARAAGIHAIRNPFEPSWSLRATPGAPLLRRAEVSLLRKLGPTFLRIVADEGFETTDGAIGVLATGTLDAPTLNSLIHGLPSGTWELVSHPGYNDAELARAHTRLLASRETERQALASIKLSGRFELINFSRLGKD